MRIALVGTRGVPARHGGFETAVQEIGARIVEAGHEVVVYCRSESSEQRFRGMELIHLPTASWKYTDTIVHTALSALHLILNPVDVVVLFNAGNAPIVPLLRAHRTPVILNTDGIESRRRKWGNMGRLYYTAAEWMAPRVANELIADSSEISRYYMRKHGATSHVIAYGAPGPVPVSDRVLSPFGIAPKKYHLCVARFEPENNVAEIAAGYSLSRSTHPLLIVGGTRYSAGYARNVAAVAERDSRIRLVGSVWDQEVLDQLYAGALSYVHGHSVGGTNPSLLRASGQGTFVIALDVVYNREVLGPEATYFRDASDLSRSLERVEDNISATIATGRRIGNSVRSRYDWDTVAQEYLRLCAGALGN